MVNAFEDKDSDLYALLGLKPSASDGEIRDAYYRLAKEYHPDKRKADAKAEEAFRAITRAASILRDPEMRSVHDRGQSGEGALAAKLQAARRSSQRQRIVVVFLLSLTVTTAAATKLWLVLLDRAPEPPNLVRNDPGATSLKVADASSPPEKSSRSYGPEAIPLPLSEPPSLARSDSGTSQPQQPSSGKEKIFEDNALLSMRDSSPKPERTIDAGRKAAPSAAGAETPSQLNEPPSQKTANFGLPAFDTSPAGSKPLSAKLSSMRGGKTKLADCSLSRAAKGILLNVSLALSGR
jgi:curved DNA-binding protein CbpA